MNEPPRDNRPTITLEFNQCGNYLTVIYFNASSDEIYNALWKSLCRLLGRDHLALDEPGERGRP